MMRRDRLAAFLFFLLPLLVVAQAPVHKAGMSFSISPKESKILVEFPAQGGLRTFVLDTGTPGVIVDASVVGMTPKQLDGNTVSVGGQEQRSSVSLLAFKFADTEFHAQAIVTDLSYVSQRVGRRVDGIIGMSVLKTFKRVMIDFENSTLTFER
jgi:hypothetical protein